ncbi:2-oxo-4-hydroxy-4-carboxy-5-ureidoimidazoline decarboxylase [Actinacidiphila yeochonensis]|uniref:2-oxo-4-hydroxy-4-carboxy-5-ureidoimidazoline decarboxylase n=1 Tax=Actinacidiphila yeochonensis TaxID=89050 RepID=UPI002244F522
MTSDTPPEGPTPLERLNSAATADAVAALLECCGSRRWARRVAAHRPYPTIDALLAAAEEAAYDLAPDDLAEALAGEIAAAFPDPGNLAVHTALRAAHAAYEARFGHAFVISLDETDPTAVLDQTLTSLRARLGHDQDTESMVAAEQLRGLCRGRLLRLAGRPGSPDRAGSNTTGLPRRTAPIPRRYDSRGRWTVPGRA